ncbi:MAG: DNA topoisomerase IV subunit B [Candidatus Yonathbacteria bacterium RIFCSPHIGHO2_01_FULL_44_41]|uniref:DNA topoisomerase (ATP-hydrolyzing) n=1 Tax=Candidatus Yonathbacteria bacterium RIFCSPHIGHO2_02_FULL_44_14 TaxID=1802724 RepID=A0A1G2SAB7_9BACT|nr:MAG: DNA topoisomerase IV subunit B [Candidatus Yonathbacteria bacterium RIFCSPHIGHO2_01_FULL_44_41]OHA80784.1 MAG: DNA topoisomerase IV subunit B [Candidatus Yonathbacteria bacterium RIFCSPLOWO2_01_FULL_43_20]OHA82005.1 MAG: DNA topoisomerase IV subunit B [Candidatus Yonathbacteria bacterium RIFCSPHIGHO2_02_FULL_44_14]
MAKKDEKVDGYGAEDIVVLEGLEPVRKRPGMYIGSTGPEGLHHLVWEIFDNSRDEAMGGFADHIEVALLPNNRVRVVDNGRGIPTDIHSKTKVSALETIMTTLHAGGKFEGTSYKVSGGLHGVGASVVNALSVYTKVEVHRDGAIHMQEYERGKRKAAVKKVGTTKYRGTIVTFEPDEQIFKEMGWNWNQIVNHLRQQAYLVKGLQIVIIDARKYEEKLKLDNEVFLADFQLEVPSMSFYFDGGLVSLVRFYNQHQKPVHKNICYVEKEVDDVMVEVAFQYIDDISSRELAFANNIYNMEGGTHVTGFRTSLTRRINDYARKNNFLKEADENFTADDVREGLTCAISVKMREIQFEGQTKGKLGSVEARGAVEKVFGEALAMFMEENPDDARAIINKVILALRARKAAKAAKDSVLRKGALEGLTLPGKLADCQTNKAEDSELFIVEGDSAGGSSKQGRDRKTQAILPLKGKILNVERARLDRMLESNEIKSLVIALGVGIGDVFDLSKLRYHKIIIATDADVDGAHIRALLLTLFYRYFKKVIEGGFIYIAQPPLYKIKRGKEITYAYTEEEKIAFLGKDISMLEVVEEAEGEGTNEGTEEEMTEAEEEKGKKRTPKISLQRYKGLGEMNPEELWETTMNPKSRILKQVTIDDAVDADKAFDVLMGEDVAARKSFIQSNAKMANIDA